MQFLVMQWKDTEIYIHELSFWKPKLQVYDVIYNFQSLQLSIISFESIYTLNVKYFTVYTKCRHRHIDRGFWSLGLCHYPNLWLLYWWNCTASIPFPKAVLPVSLHFQIYLWCKLPVKPPGLKWVFISKLIRQVDKQ